MYNQAVNYNVSRQFGEIRAAGRFLRPNRAGFAQVVPWRASTTQTAGSK